MPDLYLIAGPNGAGKSTYSETILSSHSPGLIAFDGDLEYKKALKLTPESLEYKDRKELAHAEMSTLYNTLKREALDMKKDFAYETNFFESFAMEVPKEFQRNGYKIHLYYIGLESIEKSVERVATRVKKQGHNIPLLEINFRYNGGLMNLMNQYHKFDTCTISSNSTGIEKLACYEKGILKSLEKKDFPEWFKKLELPMKVKKGITI